MMKEKLSAALGGFGVVLWYIIGVLYAVAPLTFLGFPFWTDLLLIIAMDAIPIVGELIRLVLYVWAFIVVVGEPIDGISIVFFVFASLYLFTTVLPFILSLFSKNHDL